MQGFIFEYYKYLSCQTNSIIDWKLPREDAKNTFLTFGDFDRLKVHMIQSFDRYRDLSELAKKWVGNRQSLRLYTLENSPSLSYKEDGDEFGFYLNKKRCDCHKFVALTCFTFLETKRDPNSEYESLLSETSEQMQKIIKQYKFVEDSVLAVVLGNIGDFGVSVLWFADQFTDVLNLVDIIKTEMPKTFQKVNTVFSLNNFSNYDDECFTCVNGKTFVFITLKRALKDAIPLEIKQQNKNVYHISGEYDLMFEMDAAFGLKMFKNNKYFNHDLDEYQKRFLQTKTILCRRIEDLEEYKIKDAPENGQAGNKDDNLTTINNVIEYLAEIESIYQQLRITLKEKFPQSAGLIDTLDSLVCDYRYNAISATNGNWAEDFSYIFEKNLKCISDLAESKPLENQYRDKKPVLLRKLMNNLKQQIFHIAECSSMGHEIPKCHLRYTGQEDSIMFCYMNIIKEILDEAYHLDSVNKQTEIIPVITVDATPIIETDLYFDNSCIGDEEDLNLKILSVNLPHVSFYDIPNYMMYLYQEIYQHIVPQNREKRDFYIGILLTMTLFKELLMEYLRADIKDKIEENVRKRFCDNVSQSLFEWICKNFPNIHNNIVDNARTNDSKLIAKNYINNLMDYWETNIVSDISIQSRGFHGNQFADCLQDLYKSWLKFFPMKDEESWVCLKHLKSFVVSQNSSNFILVAAKCKSRILRIFEDNFIGLQRTSADIAMIELAEMSMEEYFVSYLIRQGNLLDDKNNWRLGENRSESVRLHMIIRYFQMQKNFDWDGFENNFKYMFIARKSMFTKRENIKRDVNENKQSAEYWFEKISSIKREVDEIKKYDHKVVEAFWEEVGVENKLKGPYKDKHGKAKRYFQDYRASVKSYSDKIAKSIELNNGTKLYEDYLIYQQEVFEENIKLLQHFQKGPKLKEIGEKNKENNAKKTVECTERTWQELDKLIDKSTNTHFAETKDFPRQTYYVNDIMQLMDAFEGATRLLKNSSRNVFQEERSLWYRGQRSAEFDLLPYIMRPIDRNKNSRNYNYLAQYQRQLFEEFKYKAEGSPEMQRSSQYKVADYIALMQHYCVGTNFLDWSEDAFTSTYFALETLINGEQTNVNEDPVIYIFSPHLYNRARTQMMNDAKEMLMDYEKVVQASKRTIGEERGEIPNLSIEYNQERFDMFLLGNVAYEEEKRGHQRKKLVLNGGCEMAFLPIAAYTSQLNPRIKSQSGIFLVYNLYAERSLEGDFSYLGLGEIQDYYLRQTHIFDSEPFLYKIIINKRNARNIALCFKALGLSKGRIYPELMNIGEQIF